MGTHEGLRECPHVDNFQPGRPRDLDETQIWAVRYFKNSFVVLLPTEIMQRTASKRIKKIPYNTVVHIEEFQVRWSPVVRITGTDGTVIRADALQLDVAALRQAVAQSR